MHTLAKRRRPCTPASAPSAPLGLRSNVLGLAGGRRGEMTPNLRSGQARIPADE